MGFINAFLVCQVQVKQGSISLASWMKSSLTSSFKIQIFFLYFNKWLLCLSPFSFNILNRPSVFSEGCPQILFKHGKTFSIRSIESQLIMKLPSINLLKFTYFLPPPVVLWRSCNSRNGNIPVLIPAPIQSRDRVTDVTIRPLLTTNTSNTTELSCYLSHLPHLRANKGRCNVISLTEH